MLINKLCLMMHHLTLGFYRNDNNYNENPTFSTFSVGEMLYYNLEFPIRVNNFNLN